MDQAQMTKRCPDSKLIGIGTLKNYSICFPQLAISREYLGVAGIKKEKHNSMQGLIYELSDSDVLLLDVAEGFKFHDKKNSSYIRNDVGIILNDELINAFIYLSNIPTNKNYLVSTSYLLLLVKNMIKYEFNISYIKEVLDIGLTGKKPTYKEIWEVFKSKAYQYYIKKHFLKIQKNIGF
jgi:hypothetical protein